MFTILEHLLYVINTKVSGGGPYDPMKKFDNVLCDYYRVLVLPMWLLMMSCTLIT